MEYDDGASVEGADDPGILIGLEMIDGNSYSLETVGAVTRLVPNVRDKG